MIKFAIKWIIIIALVALAWTAFEKGHPWVKEHGLYGLAKAAETNLINAWHSAVNGTSDASKKFEKDHKEFFCGTKGC